MVSAIKVAIEERLSAEVRCLWMIGANMCVKGMCHFAVTVGFALKKWGRTIRIVVKEVLVENRSMFFQLT